MTRTINNLKPNGDRLLVLPDHVDEQVTESGLVIPEDYDSMKNTPVTGLVVAVGDDVKNVNVNDILLYQKLYELSVDIGGVRHIIIKAEHVIGTSTQAD